MASCDDDIPPLEDMSDLIQQVNKLKETKHANHISSVQLATQENRNSEKLKECVLDTSSLRKSTNTTPKYSQSETTSFGGMKKGFLFGGISAKKGSTNCVKISSATTTVQNNESDIPFIKPKNDQKEKYEISEVQEAMKSSQTLLNNKEWVTEDLLTKVMKSETLGKRLSDPRFMQAMNEFQSNPTSAMQKYQNDTEVQSFLKEFCGLMGEHFTTLAEKQDKVKPIPSETEADISVRSSTNPKQATAQDEQKMQEILSDPEISAILLDPQIQKIIETLRTNPDKVQKALHLADRDLQEKIKKLVKCGLLQFQ